HGWGHHRVHHRRAKGRAHKVAAQPHSATPLHEANQDNMKQIRTRSLLALFACIPSAPLAAQWLNQPTAGIPRNADGKPNLTAPAPRAADGHPDLSGFWRSNWKGVLDATADLKPADIAPWAQALVKQRGEDLAKDYMPVLCLPAGPAFPTSLM